MGVSVYTEDEALNSLNLNWVSCIQIPFNILDQRMSARVFKLSKEKGSYGMFLYLRIFFH